MILSLRELSDFLCMYDWYPCYLSHSQSLAPRVIWDGGGGRRIWIGSSLDYYNSMAGEVQSKMIEVVNLIPYGKVSSYGRIAQVVNILWSHNVSAQVIGRLLSGLPESQRDQLPRRRVVNKKWVVTSLKLGEKWLRQIKLLEKEWIKIVDDQMDMSIYGYDFEGMLD